MKNAMKKLMPLLLVGCMGMTTLASCTSNRDGDDGTKSILKIGVFNGGLGYRWTELVAQEFEEKYANVSFEEGKTGVKVRINPQKTAFTVSAIQSAIMQNHDAEDIYYTTYHANVDYAREGYSMNITDWMQEKVYTADGELADMTYDAAEKKYILNDGAEAPTMSLADKMLAGTKESFYLGANKLDFNKDGNSDIKEGYYAIPFEDEMSGFVYDHDLFKEKGWLDYDGIDGLPDNMEDFFHLLDRISGAGMIPFTFSTGVSEYMRGLMDAFIGQYEGADAAALNYTYNGQYTFPAGTFDSTTVATESITINQDGTQTVTITPANAWMLAYQPSKELYVEFMRRLFDTRYYDPDCYQASYSYTVAQQEFVWSMLGRAGQPRIAMLYEGEWWENEARSYFNTTGGYGNRDFRYFPLPYIEGQKDENVRSLANFSRGSDLIVNAKTNKAELCRLWLQFAHSESALETFTLETGATRMYDYDLDSSQLSTLTKFAQNCYNIKKSSSSDVTVFYSKIYTDQHPFYDNTPMGGFGSEVLSTTTGEFNKISWTNQHLGYLFFANAGQPGATKLSAAQYIEDMYEYYSKENWTRAYNEWVAWQN